MEGKSCCNHGPAWVVKIKLPAQIDAPSPMCGNRVVVFVPESVCRNSEMFAFPADSLRVRVHAKQVERKPKATIAVKPKDTIEVALEPQAPRKRLFESYNLLGTSMAYGYIRTLIVVVEVIGQPFWAVIQYILPVVQRAVPCLP